MTRLPGSAQEIADVIGRDQALHLIGSLPASGSRSWRVCFYVPARLSPDHKLVRILGWRDAEKLVRVFGGLILQPSNCNFLYREFRNRSLLRLYRAGQDVADLADQFGLSLRQVKNIIQQEDTTNEARAAI